MSDTFIGFAVTLEGEISHERAEAIRSALYQIRGVVDVRPIANDGIESAMTEIRVRREIAQQLYGVAKDLLK